MSAGGQEQKGEKGMFARLREAFGAHPGDIGSQQALMGAHFHKENLLQQFFRFTGDVASDRERNDLNRGSDAADGSDNP